VTVPPFHNQSVTSPVSVGIFVMTNAGRSHDAQPFTYTPDSGTAVTADVFTERCLKCQKSSSTSQKNLNHKNRCFLLHTADKSNVQTVKTEGPSMVKTCKFDGQIKSLSSEQTDGSAAPSKRLEDTPMEVSSNPPCTNVFKVRSHSFSIKEEYKYLFQKCRL